jgi:hypothetical protein
VSACAVARWRSPLTAAAAEAWPYLSYGSLVTVSPWGAPVVASLGPAFLVQLPKGSIPFGRDGEK